MFSRGMKIIVSIKHHFSIGLILLQGFSVYFRETIDRQVLFVNTSNLQTADNGAFTVTGSIRLTTIMEQWLLCVTLQLNITIETHERACVYNKSQLNPDVIS